jgi:hypothetical protein
MRCDDDEGPTKRASTFHFTMKDIDMERQRSFYQSMDIYAPDMFEKGPSPTAVLPPTAPLPPTAQLPLTQPQPHFAIEEEEHRNVFRGFPNATEDPQRLLRLRNY